MEAREKLWGIEILNCRKLGANRIIFTLNLKFVDVFGMGFI